MKLFFEIIIWAVLALAWLVSVWTFFSVLLTSRNQFKNAGQSKFLWLIFVVGIFAALPYLVAIRPKVQRAHMIGIGNVRYGN